MLNHAPIAMPQSAVQQTDEPHDFVSWLKKTLLGGQAESQIDPSMSSLLMSLLSQGPENGNTL